MTPQQIKNLRAESGLTQKKFGALVSVTERTVARWEAGDRVPAPQTLELLMLKLSDLSYDQHLEAGEKEGVGSCKECGNDYSDMPNSGGLCEDCYNGQTRFTIV